MFKHILLLLTLTLPTLAHAFDVAAALGAADAYRLPGQSMQLDSHVALYEGETLTKERDYRVYIKPGRRSLVLFQSPIEAGQKVLMVEDNFWLLMPKSRRPMRITPMQKLLGDAAAGDIATLTWSDYYDATLVDEAETREGRRCVHLSLTARYPSSTYHQIELWLDSDDLAPVAADLYVTSGKLAKQATYQLEAVEGRRQVTTTTLIDRLQNDRRTVITHSGLKEVELDDKLYNPQYLIHAAPEAP